MSPTQKWVVIVSETQGGETACQVVSEEYATEAEADDFACDVAYANPKADWLIEVCTVDEAAQVVTE
jgi:hypothetical protein